MDEEESTANTTDSGSARTATISLEIPGNGNEKERYANVTLPRDQYEWLDDVKSTHGMTWRGLVLHTCRVLSDAPLEDVSVDREAANDQYALFQEIRKRHGLTWKGMVLYAARDLVCKQRCSDSA